MIIDCVSDLHGSYPILEGGDLLIIAGDLTARDRLSEYPEFVSWVKKQEYKKVIIIGGNHDKYLMKKPEILGSLPDNATYLLNSGIEYGGCHIWGSPHTKWFSEVNPDCNAFMLRTDADMKEIWNTIPYNTDILVTHGPPRDILDQTRYNYCRVGCSELEKAVQRIKPKLHVFGHIHEGYGTDVKQFHENQTTFVNCAHMNVDYRPVNKPIRIVLEV